MGKIIFFPRTTRALSYGRGRNLKKIQKCEIFLARTRMQRWQEYLNLKTISEMLWKYGTFLVMTRMQRWQKYPHLKQSMMFIWRFPRLCSLEHLISWRLSVVLFFILENSFLRSFIWCIVGRMFSISIEKWKNMVLVLEDLGGFAFASCWGVLSCSVGSGSQKMRSFSFAFNLCWNALLVLVGAKKGRWFSFSFGSWDVLLVGSSCRCSSCPIDSQDTEVRNCPMIQKEKIEAKRKRKSRQDWQENRWGNLLVSLQF